MNINKAEFTLPEQLENPDWSEVKEYALQAASATMRGDIKTANDLYQYIAIEVMSTLYGPNAVGNFLEFAMNNEPANQETRIVLA
jgi:hypothetical protein